jgi:hypothetical protein
MSLDPSSSGGHVRILQLGVCALLIATTTAFAQAPGHASQAQPKPSEESLRHLLEVTQAKKVLQTIAEQMDATFDAMVRKQLGAQQDLTPEQQKSLETRRRTAADMIAKLLSWDSMEALYLKVYGETFTQAEIDGMLKFYATPAGQAVIAKLPLVAKNTMSEMQQRVQQMMPKLQQLAKETAEEVKGPEPATKGG